jgi:16S rRNA C1402 (ribose-2'-O) methylase RsmI
MSLWQAPTRWIRIGTPVHYITWNLASWEEPDPDIFRSPLHCVYATADCIETRSEAGRPVVADPTANVIARLETISLIQPVRRAY